MIEDEIYLNGGEDDGEKIKIDVFLETTDEIEFLPTSDEEVEGDDKSGLPSKILVSRFQEEYHITAKPGRL